MKVYIVIDDCPRDLDEKRILEVYGDPLAAYRDVERRKKDDAYQSQYVTVLPMELK